MSKIMASFPRVCPALQAEYGDEPIPVRRINEAVAADSGCDEASVCVADHCYNRHNKGNSVKLNNRKFFRFVTPGFYMYVGPDFNFTGEIYQKPQGSKELQLAGSRVNGQLV